jgi:hypothetical protein
MEDRRSPGVRMQVLSGRSAPLGRLSSSLDSVSRLLVFGVDDHSDGGPRLQSCKLIVCFETANWCACLIVLVASLVLSSVEDVLSRKHEPPFT